MAPKRKHVTLNIKEKHEIWKKLEFGVSGASLAAKYNVGTSTISDIKKNKSKIEKFVGNCYQQIRTRKTLRQAEYPEMEKRLYNWFRTQRSRHIPVSFVILAAMAKKIYAEVYGRDNFVASRGWLSKFKSRHGLRRLRVCGEKLSSNEPAVSPFLSKFKEKILALGVVPAQIYNCDESALFWKMLPDKTVVDSHEKTAPGRKVAKERVTFLLCTNSDGSHKIKPLVIGKSKHPRAFKNVDLPVDYKSSKNAWMTSDIFREWLQNFVKQVRSFLKTQSLDEKALLLMDNATCHCPGEENIDTETGEFTIMFLPPNTTATIQPLDQNIIQLTKLAYRKSLLSHILSSDEDDISKCIKSLTLRDAVFWLSHAWQSISPVTISKSWKKILNSEVTDHDEYENEDHLPLSVLKSQIISARQDIHLVSSMLKQTGGEVLTEVEVQSWICGDENLLPLEENNQHDSDDDEQEPVRRKIKNEEAVKALNVALEWAKENDVPPSEVTVLQRLHEKAFFMKNDRLYQTKITNFF
jgi:hypothetical protein